MAKILHFDNSLKHKPGQFGILQNMAGKTFMRVLLFSTLYPSAARPSHGIFVENRLKQVMAMAEKTGTPLDVRVIAPVPWFPFKAERFGEYARFANTPETENRHGIQVKHPSYLLPPKVGMTYAAHSLANCLRKSISDLKKEGFVPDLIDAHYYYPDGVAAAKVAQEEAIPFVVTARGTDINLIPQYPAQRRMIMQATRAAAQSITVCQALKDEMVALGADQHKITVLRNGVDLKLFQPTDKEQSREALGLKRKTLLSVGHLIERKGHHLIIEAMADLPDYDLLIAGIGPEESHLKKLAADKGVVDRVTFLGQVPHNNLKDIYSAVDALILASSREGWPNVLLETMACGTPAIATPVWGSGEVITAPEAGRLTEDRSAPAIVNAVKDLFQNLPSQTDTRLYAEQYSWDETAKGVLNVFKNALVTKPHVVPDWGHNTRLKTGDDIPKLMVTVDTEEIFDWSANEFDKYKVAAPKDIERFQLVCDKYNVKPLYFVTASLMSDPASATYLRDLHETGRADLGLHLHQWVTPPYVEEATAFTSYQCNLPHAIHEEKLKNLMANFETVFGFPATSHRAGRYGVAPHILEALAKHGVSYDFSPSAGFDLSLDGGPDFSGVTSHPFHHKTASTEITCLPATGGRMVKRTMLALPQNSEKAGHFVPLANALRNQTASIRLSPEGFSQSALNKLSRRLIKDDVGLLVFSLHSTSLTLGATPYSETAQAIDELIGRTETYFKWFSTRLNGEFWSLKDLSKLH